MSWDIAYLRAAHQGHQLTEAGCTVEGHAIVQCSRCLGMMVGRRNGKVVVDEQLCHTCLPLGTAPA